MIKSKNRVGGKVLSIILSGCIVSICAYILCMDNYLKTHKPKFDVAFKDGVGLVYESNAQIYKDDISSNSRLLITCSEWITEDVRVFLHTVIRNMSILMMKRTSQFMYLFRQTPMVK